jgi:hypothetical protein
VNIASTDREIIYAIQAKTGVGTERLFGRQVHEQLWNFTTRA